MGSTLYSKYPAGGHIIGNPATDQFCISLQGRDVCPACQDEHLLLVVLGVLGPASPIAMRLWYMADSLR